MRDCATKKGFHQGYTGSFQWPDLMANLLLAIIKSLFLGSSHSQKNQYGLRAISTSSRNECWFWHSTLDSLEQLPLSDIFFAIVCGCFIYFVYHFATSFVKMIILDWLNVSEVKRNASVKLCLNVIPLKRYECMIIEKLLYMIVS